MNKDIFNKLKERLSKNQTLFQTPHDYFVGRTDAMKNYKMITDRSKSKTPVNFIKKFIREEVAYSLGNDITLIAGTKAAVEPINRYNYHKNTFEDGVDSKLAQKLLLYGIAYEVYIYSKDPVEGNLFDVQVIDPRSGAHIYENDELYFIMKIKQEEKETFKVYDSKNIYYYDDDGKRTATKEHLFKATPIGIAQFEEGIEETIYSDIKGLQDAYETNLSDISNEISDFRNAYLMLIGVSVTDDQGKNLKKEGMLNIKNKDGKADWLIKNINDSFIQNTLKTLEDKMYQITGHINHNEAMQSNTSSLALRTRLISLEQKCKLNQKVITECIKRRLYFFLEFLRITEGVSCSFREILIKFTPNIPQDDLMMANIINTLGPDRLSTATALSLLSFVHNPEEELKDIEAQQSKLRDGMLALQEAELELQKQGLGADQNAPVS